MITVDTSAMIAILQEEDGFEDCEKAMLAADERIMSAGTLHELLVVSTPRGLVQDAENLIAAYGVSVHALTEGGARAAAIAYAKYGKGIHPARLNLSDCYAYALARDMACPLLYAGTDFDLTDVERALP